MPAMDKTRELAPAFLQAPEFTTLPVGALLGAVGLRFTEVVLTSVV